MTENIENKYVAFCDILGFSNSIITDFDKVKELYLAFKEELEKYDIFDLKISIYSDSILIVGDEIFELSKAVQILLWSTLRYGWIVRGGIAYGKHWTQSDENNLLVISEALVKAVNIEKTISHPVIAISDEIKIDSSYWLLSLERNFFELPIMHFNGIIMINPFNKYWYKSAEIKLNELKTTHKSHSHKYEFLLEIISAIKNKELTIPTDANEYLNDYFKDADEHFKNFLKE